MADHHASVDQTPPKSVEEPRKRPNSITIDTAALIAGPNSPRRPAPSSHLPTNPKRSSASDSYDSSICTPASPIKSSSHGRSMSVMDSAQRANRLSMSFPILPPTSRTSRPPSWANSPMVSPTAEAPNPGESNILTQLAAQERRVLELRESLRQAEAELDKLKKHWATHEALKKRSDVRRVQQLQPVSANLSSIETSEDDVDGSSQWLQKEMERRKQLLGGVRTSNRKVFSGSKHTRTLSLLSPEKGTFSQPFPQPADANLPRDGLQHSPTLHRSSGTFDAGSNTAKASDDSFLQLDGTIPKDVLLRTGRQMANDIKDGLWTFFEDIRQATVGDEAIYGPEGARQSEPRPLTRSNTTGSAKTRNSRAGRASTTSVPHRDMRADTLIDAGGSFWREHGVETPTSKPAVQASRRVSRKSTSPLPDLHTDDEPWDSWGTPSKKVETPPQQYESSSDSSEPYTNSDITGTPMTDEHSRPTPPSSTDRMSYSKSSVTSTTAKSGSDSRHNSIPWPDLDKLTPSNLKRTASHLMKEWERSLTPSPAGEFPSDLAAPVSSGSKAKNV